MGFKYTLEKYKGCLSRKACPQCGVKGVFVRYVNNETGEPLAHNVGRCNRESKCGYHRTPHDYFAEKGNLNCSRRDQKQNFAWQPALVVKKQSPKSFDCISADILRSSLRNYEQNAFVRWLLSEIEADEVIRAIKCYFIGTAKNGRTVFWQVDEKMRIRTGKNIAYDQKTGKRLKDRKPSFVHAELKHAAVLPETFELKQCLFGQHLLQLEPEKPLGIVESEKTAIIASIFFPQFNWLATGGKSNLKAENLERFTGRRIILFPDADAYEHWQAVAQKAKQHRLNVFISDLIDQRGTLEEKQEGFDLADYILLSSKHIREKKNYLINCARNNS